MLSVIIIWLFILATTSITGFCFIDWLTDLPFMQIKRGERPHQYTCRFRESYIVCGIILITVYSEIWSIFGGVALWADTVLVMICILILVVQFRKHPYLIRKISGRFKPDGIFSLRNPFWKKIVLYTILFLIMAYGTSHGIEHYDTGLYHAQAIHWIESMGVVRGLGNLHLRLAYNSAAFPLSALFSFSYLGGQSYHTCAGFFGLLLVWKCADIVNIRQRKKPVISDFVRLVGLYYIFSTYDEIVSPASDYFTIFMILYIVICWMDLDVRGEKAPLPYALLAIAAVYSCTLKLSAAPFMLLVIKPVAMYLKGWKTAKDRGRRAKCLAMFTACGIATVLPFLIRNYILSGWLVYPFTAIDIFNVRWKIPKGTAEYDAAQIKAFGRGYTDIAACSMKTVEWLPHWFAQVGTLNKLFIIADVIAAAGFIAYVVWIVIQRLRSRNGSKLRTAEKIISIDKRRVISDRNFIFITTVLYSAIFFWMLTSPLIRYGYVFLMLPCAVIVGRLVIALFYRGKRAAKLVIYRFMTVGTAAFILYKIFFVGMYDIEHFQPQYTLRQQDYSSFATREFETGGVTFYYPEKGDQAGYAPFPSLPAKKALKLMGAKPEDGFLPE